MKRIGVLLGIVLMTGMVWGQDITGQWNGVLKVQGMQLRLVFNISAADSGYTATMDSPDQGAKGIPVTTVTFADPVLTLKIAAAMIDYTGELKDGVVKGTFKQGGMSFDMDLQREGIAKVESRRPQDPVQPYPYRSEEVTFDNGPDVRLAGTLTIPSGEGRFPVAVLISGSGPQNRDEELLGHRPFLVLADHLTRNGIAVLRYDDRGTAASTGNFRDATTETLATDAEAAVAFLKGHKDIDPGRIGLIGHSEGGIIAPLVASRRDIAFIVMLAGTGISGLELLPKQAELIARASGTPEADITRMITINTKIFSLVADATSEETLRTDLETYLTGVVSELPASEKPQGVSDKDFISGLVNQVANPWMRFFLTYDPIPALKKVTCPVLALNGTLDMQVPYRENLEPIRKALKKNRSAKIVELEGMNHLFQECTTGSPSEYGQIETTLSPKMLQLVSDWLAGIWQ